MKQLLITIPALVLVGCGESQQSTPASESKPAEPVAEAATPEPPTAKAPDISIHRAARKGNIDVVKQHLAAGTDVNQKSSYDGATALNHAAWHGHMEIAQLLLKNGANKNAKRNDGWTPMHDAAAQGHNEIVDLLIANGWSVKVQDNKGKTPLHPAVYSGHKEIAELLIAEGADVNAMTENGLTALHVMAIAGHKEIAELLIAKGADVNVKNKLNGETPLGWAIRANNLEIANLLREHGGK